MSRFKMNKKPSIPFCSSLTIRNTLLSLIVICLVNLTFSPFSEQRTLTIEDMLDNQLMKSDERWNEGKKSIEKYFGSPVAWEPHNSVPMQRYWDRCNGADYPKLFARFEKIQSEMIKTKKGKALVWSCRDLCGGLGDRIRGMITTFLLALLMKRAFFVDHRNPCDISNIVDFANPTISFRYDPALYETDGVSIQHDRIIDQYENYKYEYRTRNFSAYITSDLYFLEANLPVQSYLLWNPHFEKDIRELGLDKINYIDLSGCIIGYLLKPIGNFKSKLERILADHRNETIVGIQIRTGGDSAAWSDDIRVKKSEVAYFWNCAWYLEKQFSARKKMPPFRWFITTDSDETRSKALTQFGSKVFDIPGVAVHIDKFAKEEACKGLEKTWLDFFVLSSSQHFVISRSNFAEVAVLRSFSSAYIYPQQCSLGNERTDFTRWLHVEGSDRT